MLQEPPFDPCRQWLGIDAVDLGNPRRVLGIAAREADPAAVVRAAESRLGLLRSLSPGPFEAARASLLKRVEEARDKILAEIASTGAKSAPGAPVRFSMPAPPSSLAGTAPAGIAPPVPPRAPPVPPAVPVAQQFDGGRSDTGPGEVRIRTTIYRKKTPVGGIVLALLSLAGAAGGLAYYSAVVKKGGPGAKLLAKVTKPAGTKANGTAETNGKAKAVRKPEPETEPESEAQAVPTPPPPQPDTKPDTKPQSEPKPEPGDGTLEAALGEVLAALRLKEPDPETVGRALAAAAKEAKTKTGRTRVGRWQLLAEYYGAFLDNRQQALAAVEPGNEYDVNGRKIIVVEIDDEAFKYRISGENKITPRDRIPAGIVLAIVTRWFANGRRPANELLLGAYHLVKPESEPARARGHWEKAGQRGADAGELLPLLDDPLFAAGQAEK